MLPTTDEALTLKENIMATKKTTTATAKPAAEKATETEAKTSAAPNTEAKTETKPKGTRKPRKVTTQAERDRAQMDKLVKAYNRKLRVKDRLDKKRDEVKAARDKALAAADENLAPVNEAVEDLRFRITQLAPITGDSLADLLGEDAVEDEFEGSFPEGEEHLVEEDDEFADFHEIDDSDEDVYLG